MILHHPARTSFPDHGTPLHDARVETGLGLESGVPASEIKLVHVASATHAPVSTARACPSHKKKAPRRQILLRSNFTCCACVRPKVDLLVQSIDKPLVQRPQV